MSKKLIDLFMWSYQHLFRINVEIRINNVMKKLGVSEPGAECLLVGTRIPGYQIQNEVCVEPEDGQWPVDLFTDRPTDIEKEIASHHMQDEFYDDELRTQEKPKYIYRDSVRRRA